MGYEARANQTALDAKAGRLKPRRSVRESNAAVVNGGVISGVLAMFRDLLRGRNSYVLPPSVPHRWPKATPQRKRRKRERQAA